MHKRTHISAFTLIELSIVLVIIGLIVGGILVGQDMIKSAEVRAQISQIEKYHTAVNTFKSKFNAIPGDMDVASAKQFGFAVGASCNGNSQGFRNGDGLLDGYSPPYTLNQGKGETGLFWIDISSTQAGSLIAGTFPNSGAPALDCFGGVNLSTTTGTTYVGDYMPAAAIGHGNFVYVYETSGFNWYGVSAVTSINSAGDILGGTTIPAMQAYNIDKKIDDGIPVTGAVRATYDNTLNWAQASPTNAPSASADTLTSCYNTTSNAYSISSLANFGSSGTCALSFRFQ